MNIFTISKLALVVSIVFGLALPTAALAAGPASVNLGSAGNFVILSKTGVSTTGSTAVTGDIGVSPAQATYITGFALTLPASSASATSAIVTGKVYAPGYADPTSATLTTAVLDMQTAYTDAAGRAADVTELGAGNIGGLTLAPSVYKWGTGVTIPADMTLSGGASDVWIFQIAQDLSVSSGVKIMLAGGAQASNIFWQVAGQTTLGTNAVFNGTILDQTAIVLNTGATLNGRALAQTAVTLDANAVTMPSASVAASVVVTPTPAATTTTATTPSTNSTTSTSSGQTSSPQASSSGTTANQTMTTTSSAQATQTSGISAAQVQAILDVLASFNADASVIANVKTSLGGTSMPGSATSAAVVVFKTNLTLGSLGSEVKALQQYLNKNGYTVATSGAGSAGNETTTFGAATRAALVKFQNARGITPAVGYFGPKTRAAVNL